MATRTTRQGHQSLSIEELHIPAGESVTVAFAEARHARVDWHDGGVTWTINPERAGESFSCAVEHSLSPSGDEAYLWVPDEESPFSEPSDGVEEYRMERVRFTAESGDVVVVVATASKVRVEGQF